MMPADPKPLPELSQEERERYRRHLQLPDFGMRGQQRLKQARVLIVGAGGLGSPAAMYLTAAGVGTLGLADDDVVDHSNLQRQILHGTADVGRPKLESARDTLQALNPGVKVELHPLRVEADCAAKLVETYDLVLDGTDNFTTRYLLNDACVLAGVPYVYGCIYRFEGQVSVFGLDGGPCYRCLYPEPPPTGGVPNCAEGGVLGILPGVVGLLQATEAVKILSGIGTSLRGRVLLYDALSMRFNEMTMERNPSCPLCGEPPTLTRGEACTPACAVELQSKETSPMNTPPEILPAEVASALQADAGSLRLLDVREPFECDICALEGALRIPMGEVPARVAELDSDAHWIIFCKSGVRSARIVDFLAKEAGFSSVRNLVGGILRWADEVDDTMAKY